MFFYLLLYIYSRFHQKKKEAIVYFNWFKFKSEIFFLLGFVFMGFNQYIRVFKRNNSKLQFLVEGRGAWAGVIFWIVGWLWLGLEPSKTRPCSSFTFPDFCPDVLFIGLLWRFEAVNVLLRVWLVIKEFCFFFFNILI